MDKMKLSKTYKIHTLYNENIYQGMLHIYTQPMNAKCWCNSGGIALTRGTELETETDCLMLVKYVK